MQVIPQLKMIHKEPKNKQPSTICFFHCNFSLMVGMMDGKLGFKNGKFVGCDRFLSLEMMEMDWREM